MNIPALKEQILVDKQIVSFHNKVNLFVKQLLSLMYYVLPGVKAWKQNTVLQSRHHRAANID